MSKFKNELKIYIPCVFFLITQLYINDLAARPGGWDEINWKYIQTPETNIVRPLTISLLSILMSARSPETHVTVYLSPATHFLLVIMHIVFYVPEGGEWIPKSRYPGVMGVFIARLYSNISLQ